MPPARDGHSAVVVGDRMFLFGGFEEDLQRFSQETYVFDFLTNRWSEFNTTVSFEFLCVSTRIFSWVCLKFHARLFFLYKPNAVILGARFLV